MIRSLSIDLEFGTDSLIAVGRMGWDSARR